MNFLKTVERNIGHHGEASIEGDAKYGPDPLALAQQKYVHAALHSQFCHQPDEAFHRRCGWRWKALKIALVHHGCADVETRQAQCRANAVDKSRHPTPRPNPFKAHT